MITIRFLDELNNNGVLMNWKQVDELIAQLEETRDEICCEVNRLLRQPIDFTELDKLAFRLFDNGLYPREVTQDYFKEHRDEHPVYEQLYQYKKICQKLTQYKNLRSKRDNDDRLRGTWRLDSSSTKRLGCKEPNLMSLPAEFRKHAIPESGNVIVKCDFSQVELRILAEISKDQNLIYAFNNDDDIHKYTASLVFGKSLEDISEEERAVCKTINFGLIYGMSAATLKEKLQKMNFDCSLSYATELRNSFFDSFPDIKKYQGVLATSDLLHSLGGSQISAEMLTVNQRLNWPIQTSCSEILLESLNELMQNKHDSTKLINCIHDEIWIEADDKTIESEKEMLISSMSTGFRRYIKSVPCKIDFEIVERSI